jgi:lipopolysaccharide export system protein LptA
MFMMMPSPRSTTTGRIAHCVRGFAVLLALFTVREAAAQSSVQGVPNAMQGFSQNRDQPIQIEAATLEMRDKKKEATFSGNVKVIQGDTTMTSKTLVVYYESSSNAAGAPANGAPANGAPANGAPAASPAPASAKAAPPAKGAPIPAAAPGPGGASSIKKLVAQGNVVVTQKEQVVTGDSAVFDTRTNLVTMLGGVVLTQGKNVLRGDRLLVDMTTGVSRVESDSGRVQGLFQSSGQPGQSGSGPLGLAPASPASNKPK